jgi:predicted signal transduction protein with EAL and GGDEF domain
MVAEKVVASFGAAFTVAKRQLFVSPSVGVAIYPGDGDTAEMLIKNADAAMYKAKEQGRNTFRRYTADMNAKAKERLAVENSLHNAVERGELSLHYQPRVDLASGRIVGMEALARWDHPELGSVSPGEFIPLAEETGLIVPLGEWALTEACRQVQSWIDAGLPPMVVAVNLSARQFQQVQVSDMVASAPPTCRQSCSSWSSRKALRSRRPRPSGPPCST